MINLHCGAGNFFGCEAVTAAIAGLMSNPLP